MTESKSNAVTSTKWDGNVLTINVLGAGAVVLDIATCNQMVQEQAMREGFVKRLINRAAMNRDDKTGKSASPKEKFDAIKSLADHYASGSPDWSPNRTAKATVDPTAMLAQLLANDPEKLAAIIAAAQAAAQAKLDNAQGAPEPTSEG